MRVSEKKLDENLGIEQVADQGQQRDEEARRG